MRSLSGAMIALAVLVMTGSSPCQIFAAGNSSSVKLARQTTTFGTVGIVAGQTLRVTAIRQPYAGQVVAVCRVDLSIFDINGSQQAAVEKDLDPGKGTFLDLAQADIMPVPTDTRAEVNAVVDLTSDAKDGKPSCQVATSLEVYDQSGGRTSISQETSSPREERNLAPLGSKAACWIQCALEDASCPPDLECWQNPVSSKFLCCNGRPLQGWTPLN
jgi:hypothetical protein